MPLFDKAVPFKGQNYDALRKNCQRSHVLFVDPIFPASDSIIHPKKINFQRIEWKRPGELCNDPHLFVEGISALDVTQGQLGNCWFVAAASVLATVKGFWNKVIPDYKDQEWDKSDKNKYAGIFHFRFWRFGQWVDVVIDDQLPTVNGRLIYTRSDKKNEFWCALLEKAYAKLNGSYSALEGGNLCDALVDFTSGVSQTIDLQEGKYLKDEEKTKKLFKSLKRESLDHALMCCAVSANSEREMETKTKVGLVRGHAYGITAITKVHLRGTSLLKFFAGRDKVYMIRLRNPWGEQEWTGPFSDGSPEWKKVTESDKIKLGLTFENDGEFWMPFDEFLRHFTKLSICHLLNTNVFSLSKTWHEYSVKGYWTQGPNKSSTDRSGGCANNERTFLRNPQYIFDISDDEEEYVVQLLQEDTRDQRHKGVQELSIGFSIVKVEENRSFRVHAKNKATKVVATSEYIKSRGIYFRGTLTCGRYILLPTTFEQGKTGTFFLRVFAGTNLHIRELNKDAPKHPSLICVKYPSIATVITVMSADGLRTSSRSCNPYCQVICEGKTFKTFVQKNTNNPKWNTSFIMYRKKKKSPIKVQVWNHGALKNECLGEVEVLAPVNHEVTRITAPLQGKGKDRNRQPGGILVVTYTTEDDINAV